MGLTFALSPLGVVAVAPWLVLDKLSLFFDAVLCLGGALAALLAGGYLPEHNLDRGEFYSLLLFSTFGAMMLAAAGDALTLVLGGLVFKVSAVPFHMWTPDAYEGAPTPATTYMAVAVKSGAFAMMLRVLLTAFSDPQSMSWSAGWPPVLAGIAVLTMTVANLIAGRQESVKRMLAYSSIAHAGYILVGVTATARESADGQGAILFYLHVAG